MDKCLEYLFEKLGVNGNSKSKTWRNFIEQCALREESNGTHLIATVKNMERNRFKFGNCNKISNVDYKSLVYNNCTTGQGDIFISKVGANCLVLIFVYNQDEEIVLLSSIAILRLANQKHFYV